MGCWKRLWNHTVARPALGATVGVATGIAYYTFVGCHVGGG